MTGTPRSARPMPGARPQTTRMPDAGLASRFDWMLLTPAALTLAVTLYRLSGASYSRDETATVTATALPLPGLLRMLGHVDAVHGLYYMLAWVQARMFGTSEEVLRLPSAAAMAAAAFGVATIGRRLRSKRAGLLAGLMFAAMPLDSFWGQNARSYALVIAAAVLASYSLIAAMQEPRVSRLVRQPPFAG